MQPQHSKGEMPQVNPGYGKFQLAKALMTSEQHTDSATRTRARLKVARWIDVLQGMAAGSLTIGSRTPVGGVPAWVTPEVVTGGFATGGFMAGGEIQEHERNLLSEIEVTAGEADARRNLNSYFLSDAGIARLQEWLKDGRFRIRVPEEGALLVVAWLLEQGKSDAAHDILNAIAPFMDRLRFYPVPSEPSHQTGARVFLATTSEVRTKLAEQRTPQPMMAFREAVLVWRPHYDRLVTLFLETVEGESPSLQETKAGRTIVGGWPCQLFSPDWRDRAQDWLREFDRLRKQHCLTGKPERKKEHFAQIVGLARRCAIDPRSLTGRDVGRIRMILAHFLAKHGRPDSEACQQIRSEQAALARRPLHSEIAAVLSSRLALFPGDHGLDDPTMLTYPVTTDEAEIAKLPVGTQVPKTLARKLERCLCESVDVLVERGLITSGEVLARLLPQVTSQQRAGGFADSTMPRLYGSIYQAFRRRRSLLLLNLQSQVRLEELPWIAAVESFRARTTSTKLAARAALEEIATLALSAFPHVILPNKLLQEFRSLVKDAELDLPLVDELAADIFMGEFSDKFVAAAKLAAELLDGTIYSRYFGIDFAAIRRLEIEKVQSTLSRWFNPVKRANAFAELCAARAGVPLGTWQPATNGMIIEQQQIVTTQNLATLFVRLELRPKLQERLPKMARDCFQWILRRLNTKTNDWHARLIAVKNCAYAWRQMVFFLSLLPKQEVDLFLASADELMQAQPDAFRIQFQPAVRGLTLAASNLPLNDPTANQMGATQFLGWSRERHWLMPDKSNNE